MLYDAITCPDWMHNSHCQGRDLSEIMEGDSATCASGSRSAVIETRWAATLKSSMYSTVSRPVRGSLTVREALALQKGNDGDMQGWPRAWNRTQRRGTAGNWP
jgi:hypothetical protein